MEGWAGRVKTWIWRGSLYSQGNVANISLVGQGYQTEFLKRGGVRAIRWSIRRNASGRTTASELPSSGNPFFSFSFFRNKRNPTVRQVRSETGCNPHTHTCQKNNTASGSSPLSLSAHPLSVRNQFRGPGRSRATVPHVLSELRATCTCPLAPDVLNSYYPFKNAPLPILQRLSRELFHSPPQIRPRYRRRRKRTSHRPRKRPHRHRRWATPEMVGRSRR